MNSVSAQILVILILCISTLSSEVLADRGKVVLVSMDGFRYDYLTKTSNTPNFNKLIAQGVRVPYMDNTFETNTFPNHYTMATGLYSEVHGIIANSMYDPVFDSYFKMSNLEPRWWEGGEPIWTTAKKAGLKTGTYFWPGAEVAIHGVLPDQWRKYNKSTPFEHRVETVIGWMVDDDFDLATLYFNEPDSSGHRYGPEDPCMVPVIENMDMILGLLMDGLDDAGLKDKVNIIITSDHGMTTVDLMNKIIDVTDYVNSTLLHSLVDQGTTSNIRPQPGKARQLVEALSGVDHMKVMLKEDIPERYHFKNNRRVTPVFAIADEGWTITDNATKRQMRGYKGDHGYDNNIKRMKPIFMAQGPAFKTGVTVDPIQSIDIYPLVCHLLDIQPRPNNGSMERVWTLLIAHDTASLQTASYSLMACLAIVWILCGAV